MSSASLLWQCRIVPYSIWSCTLYKSLLLTLPEWERWSNTTWACVIWSIPEISNTKPVFNRPGLISFPLHNTLSSLKITTLAVQIHLTTWPHGQFLFSIPFILMFCCFGVGFSWWLCGLGFFAGVQIILKFSSPSCAVITATLHSAFASPGGNKSAKKNRFPV